MYEVLGQYLTCTVVKQELDMYSTAIQAHVDSLFIIIYTSRSIVQSRTIFYVS